MALSFVAQESELQGTADMLVGVTYAHADALAFNLRVLTNA